AAQARVAKEDMWRVIVALLIVVIAISTTFNAVTVVLPKLFAERLAELTRSPALLGMIAACVYVFGAMTQYRPEGRLHALQRALALGVGDDRVRDRLQLRVVV